MMKDEDVYTFYAAIVVGTVAGIFGNLLVTTYFRLIDNPSSQNSVLFGVTLLTVVIFVSYGIRGVIKHHSRR